jgi:hypothetical protein
MASDAAPQPILPTKVDEWLRIAHALRWRPLAAKQQVFIVMSTVAPLFQIQGVTAKLEDAQKLIARDVPDFARWTRDEIANRKIYGPIEMSETWFTDVFAPIGKPWYTGTHLGDEIAPPGGGRPPEPPEPNEITKVQLRVEWTHDRRPYTSTWEFSADTMAIFLTRGAAEMFLYPHDEAFFGYAHEDNLRARNGQTR